MVAAAVTVILAVVLLCGLLYVLWRELRGRSKKPSNQDGCRPSRKNISRPDRDEQVTDYASVSPFGRRGDGAEDLQSFIVKGMNTIFSPAAPPTENKASLHKLDDVGSEIKQEVLSLVGGLKNIETLHKLQKMIGDPQAAMTELSRMITGDPIMTAKILRVANSPYYGMEKKLNSISHAIMIIGLANLKSIIYSEGILKALNEKTFHRDPTMQTLWKHATYTAICASYLGYLFGGLNQGTLFTLGILHDIGKFLMMKLPPRTPHGSAAAGMYSSNWTIKEEEDTFGINHALVGRLALQHWGLSALMVETVSRHHAPGYLALDKLGMDHEAVQYLMVLFLADQAACLFAAGASSGMDSGDTPLEGLHPSYHDLVDRKKLQQLLLDRSLFGQIREAEAIAQASM